jgi:hypothetical protein
VAWPGLLFKAGNVTEWYQSSKGKVKVVWVALPGRGRWSGTLDLFFQKYSVVYILV